MYKTISSERVLPHIVAQMPFECLEYCVDNCNKLSHFNFRKKAVRAAAIKKWPGNNIPIFRKNKKETEQLDTLVDELEDCIFEPVGFNKQAIRQHIIDVMNERRRSVRKGYDYTSVR